MNKWLIIPIEVMHRELHTRFIVASIAAQRGYKVIIGQDRVVRRLSQFLPKGIMYDKSLGGKNDKKITRYAKLGFQMTAMDEEITGYWSDPDLFSSVRLSDKTLKVSKKWFSPNDEVTNDLIRRYPNHIEKLITTGMPRVDLWRKQFHGLFAQEVTRLQNEHGKFILFNSNFAEIIHARGEAFLQKQVKRHDKMFEGRAKEQKHDAQEQRKNIDAYVSLFPKLAEWFPDYKLIIRPHPSDDVGYWRAASKGHPNVLVLFEGVVTPWILASSCLLHHGCTTGIEAEIMEQPHIMYAPFPDRLHDTEEMKAFAPIENTQDKLRARMQKLLEKGFKQTASAEALSKYYAFEKDKLACEKIVDAFDTLEPTGGKLPSYLPALRFTPRQLVADYWPRTKRANAYSNQKWPGTSLQEVSNIVAQIDAASSYETNTQVNEIYPDLFMVEAAC